VSLTWRWVRESAYQWMSATDAQASAWVRRFVDLALSRGASRPAAAAFLGGWSVENDGAGDGGDLEQRFSERGAVAAPFLRTAELETALQDALHRAPLRVNAAPADGLSTEPSLALALLDAWEQAGLATVAA